MSVFKKLLGHDSKKDLDCCGIEIKEVEGNEKESCCEEDSGTRC